MTKALDKTWVRAVAVADRLMKELDIREVDCRPTLHRVDGIRMHGWRVTVVRLTDGVTKTRWVPDQVQFA